MLSIEATLDKNENDLPQLHLKYYFLELVNDILGSSQNNETVRYTIRTYSRYFNPHPIRQSYLVNSDF